MIEVLVTGGIACAFCGIWWKSRKKAQAFFSRVNQMDIILDEFIKINELEYFDYELADSDQEVATLNMLHDNDLEWIGKEITNKGFDFYRMRMRQGVTSLNHRHQFSDEFFYVLSGNIFVSYEDGLKTYVAEGEHLFIESKVYHNVTAVVDSDIIVIAKPSLIRKL